METPLPSSAQAVQAPLTPASSWKLPFSKNILVIVLVVVVIFAGMYSYLYMSLNNQLDKVTGEGHPTPTKAVIDATEKQQIEAWLQKNNLNQYGDPTDTMYAGGTPLFNEKNGQTQDRYDYILSHHPDRPWQKLPSS